MSHPRSYMLLWSRQSIAVELEMIFLSARTVWLSVQRDDCKCSSLKWTRNYFLLHHQLAIGPEVVVETRPILREDFLVLLLCLGCPGLRWMLSEPDLLQIIWLFHLRSGISIFHHFWALNTSFALSFLAWISDASIFYNSWLSATKMSHFQMLPCTIHNRGIFLVSLETGEYSIITSSFEWFAESPFVKCLPIRQEICHVSQIAVALHGIRPPFFIQSGLQQCSRSLFFNRVPLLQQYHLSVNGEVCTYNDSKINVHKLCQIQGNCHCKWLLVSTSAPRTFVSSSSVSWEVLVLHGWD